MKFTTIYRNGKPQNFFIKLDRPGKEVESMKNFVIIDMNSNKPIASVQSRNGKAALNKFKMRLTSTGFYEIRKVGSNWVLSSTYGAYFEAVKQN